MWAKLTTSLFMHAESLFLRVIGLVLELMPGSTNACNRIECAFVILAQRSLCLTSLYGKSLVGKNDATNQSHPKLSREKASSKLAQLFLASAHQERMCTSRLDEKLVTR
jgi:hypothetical protein